MPDLPPVPPLRSPSSPQLKASPLPDPTRPKKSLVPHKAQGLVPLSPPSSWALHAQQPQLPRPGARFEREVTSRQEKKAAKSTGLSAGGSSTLLIRDTQGLVQPSSRGLQTGAGPQTGVCKAKPESRCGCAQTGSGCHPCTEQSRGCFVSWWLQGHSRQSVAQMDRPRGQIFSTL